MTPVQPILGMLSWLTKMLWPLVGRRSLKPSTLTGDFDFLNWVSIVHPLFYAVQYRFKLRQTYTGTQTDTVTGPQQIQGPRVKVVRAAT